MPPATIFFYHPGEPYGFLSNFSAHPVTLDDIVYPTTEHLFQSMKTLDPVVRDYMVEMDTPRQVKKYAHTIELRPDWNDIVGAPELHDMFRDDRGIVVHLTKDHVMFTALICKFEQHADLKEQLLATGDALLVENAPKDAYWGNGPTRDGLNKVGRMLMLVRKRIRRELANQSIHA